MNVVFTIITGNYLGLAKTLFSSLNATNPDLNFKVFMVDETPDNLPEEVGFELISINKILSDREIVDYAFKYDVTEFCTSVKPACFLYLFGQYKAENVIYFDPDIYVFSKLDYITDSLLTHDVVVTPHYVSMLDAYTGDQPETLTLYVGIFNFGFVAFKRSQLSERLLTWWHSRLKNQCYADWQDALHTDQKWADFFPLFAGEMLKISRHIGLNVAPWNLFEREIIKKDDKFLVKNRTTGEATELLFVHFAGHNPKNEQRIHKDFRDMSIDKYPDYKLVRDIYNADLKKNEFEKIKNGHAYSFNYFSDGVLITKEHRRYYRAITENGDHIEDPFNEKGWFYQQLKKNKLLIKENVILKKDEMPDFSRKLRIVHRILIIVKKILGVGRYYQLMYLMRRLSRPENQLFLINKDSSKLY